MLLIMGSVSSDKMIRKNNNTNIIISTGNNNEWQYIGIGGCSVHGEEGKYGPNLVHPRIVLNDCIKYGDKAGVNAVTRYGDGFCMVQFPTKKDCLFSNLRIFGDGWVSACGTDPNPAGNYTNDNLRGFECFMKMDDVDNM